MSTTVGTSVGEFYDALAPDYDQMTSFTSRFEVERPVIEGLVRTNGIHTAVDAGCGTGFLSLLLTQLGVKVIGVDASPEMVARASAHAKEMHLSVRFLASRFDQLHKVVASPVDAVFCLGNSLPHLLTHGELLEALHAFAGTLNPGGILIIQILNYDRIIARRSRVQSVKEAGGKIFVRFYDFEKDLVRFNILILQRTPQGVQHQLDSVMLRPIQLDGLSDILATVGFRETHAYGNLRQEKFDPERSTDLVVIARK